MPLAARSLLAGIPDFNFTFPQDHTPPALSRQTQNVMPALGWHRGSLWPFR